MRVRLDKFSLVVEDMARSLAFYRHLGLELPPEADREPYVEATLPGGLRVTWETAETVRSYLPDWTRSGGGPPVVIAFRAESPAEVDRAYEELVALGYQGHKAPWDAYWGQRCAIVSDPDGNAVELFAPLDAG